MLVFYVGVVFIILLFIMLMIGSYKFELKKNKYLDKYRFYKGIGAKPREIYRSGYVLPIGFKTDSGKIIYSRYYD